MVRTGVPMLRLIEANRAFDVLIEKIQFWKIVSRKFASFFYSEPLLLNTLLCARGIYSRETSFLLPYFPLLF